MDPSTKMAIRQKLGQMSPETLMETAAAALEECSTQQCAKDVALQAFGQVRSIMPKNVGEGGRIASLGVTGAAVGFIRGVFGPVVGRALTLVPAGLGLGIGLGSKDPDWKALAMSVLGGTVATESGIEMYEVGHLARAAWVKWNAGLSTARPGAVPAKQ